ncbi:MAG: hypothetical protein V3W31_04850 [Thermodesulfobacteriota bacterium]
MRDFLIFLPLTVVFLSVKSTLFPGLPLPDLPLVIVFHIAYARPSVHGVVLAFMLGYVDDVFSGAIIGSTSFSLLFFFIVVYVLSKKVHFSGAAAGVLGTALGVALKGALSYAIVVSINPDLAFAGHVLPVAVVTGLSAPFIIAGIERITGFREKSQGSYLP